MEVCKHQFEANSDFCTLCGETRDQIESSSKVQAPDRDSRALVVATTANKAEGKDDDGGKEDEAARDAGNDDNAGDAARGEMAGILSDFRSRGQTSQEQKLRPIIVGVFGPPAAGKSFLNERLQLVWSAKNPQVRPNAIHVVPSTSRGEFTLREFVASPFATMVVDLPGEEFMDGAAGASSQVSENFGLVLEQAGALILYISAQDIAPGAEFAAATFDGAPNSSKQEVYVRFLDAARKHGSPAVFVAISQADRLGSRHIKDIDAWLHLSREAPALTNNLLQNWPRFSCGYVASHVGGAWMVLNFKATDAKANHKKALRAALETATKSVTDLPVALAEFGKVCLELQEEGPEPKTGALTQQAFLAKLGLTESDAYNSFCAMALRLSSDTGRRDLKFGTFESALTALGVHIKTTPRAFPSRPSFGVRGMFQRLFALLDEAQARAGENKRKREHIGGFADPVKPRLGWRLGVRLMHSVGLRFGLWTALAALVLLPPFLLFEAATSDANAQRDRIRERIAGIDSLPPGFAIDSQLVWSLSEDALEGLRARMQTESAMLNPMNDVLVRAPNIAAAIDVNEKGVSLEALRPDPVATGLLRALSCTAGPRCVYTAVAATLEGEPSTRPESFARALKSYWTGRDKKSVEADLRVFLGRLNKSWQFDGQNGDLSPYLGDLWPQSINSEAPVKQVLMPLLAAKLIYAHVELREHLRPLRLPKDQVAMQDELRRYGDKLGVIVDGYRNAFSKLPPSTRRQVSDTRAELNAVGVHTGTLVVHLLESALISSDSWVGFRQNVEARLKPLGLGLNTDSVLDIAQFSGDYPELLCLHQQLRRTAGESQQNPAGEACRRTRATPNAPFGLQRKLTDPGHWLEEPQQRDASLPYDQYVGPIKATAARWLPRVSDVQQRKALEVLRDIPVPAGRWEVLLNHYRWWILVWAAALVLAGAALTWLLRSKADVELINVPFQQDRNATGLRAMK